MSDITDKVKEKLKDAKDKVTSTTKEGAPTKETITSAKDKVTSTTKEGIGGVSSQLQTRSSYAHLKYSAILVPHDGSEMSDKALSHAIYLSNMSGAEIVILHVLEDIHHKDSTAVLATYKEEGERGGGGEAKDIEKSKKKDYEIEVEGEVKQMIEDKMRFCKQAGVKSQVSYKIQIGKPVDEIIKMSEDVNVDLIVIASSKKPSLTTRLLGSTSRKVIDSIEKPVLIIHG